MVCAEAASQETKKTSESTMKKHDVGKLECDIVKAKLSQLVLDGLVSGQHSTFTNVTNSWRTLRSVTCSAAETALGYHRITRLPCISEATLDVIEQRRAARLTVDLARYRSLNHDRRQSVRHDYQVWINSVACEGEDQLNHEHPRDAFANFRKLKHSPCGSTPITALDGSVC